MRHSGHSGSQYLVNLLCALSCAITLASCAAERELAVSTPSAAAEKQAAQVISLEDATAQIRRLTAPGAVEAKDFALLKEELIGALQSTGLTRFVAAAPDSPKSFVSDLSVLAEDSTLHFDWSYANQGDYDFNSQVNVSDLTPIGQHMRKRPDDSDWLAASCADGDGNEEVNISDITPIGANFNRTVDRYDLQQSTTGLPEANWQPVATCEFAQSTLERELGRRRFSLDYSPVAGELFYRVVPYHGGDAGRPSNVVGAAVIEPATVPSNLTATQGTLPGAVELNWLGVPNALTYEIVRRSSVEDEFVVLGTTGDAATHYTDAPLQMGTHHEYAVRADFGEELSELSNIAEGWPMDLPAAPQALQASKGSFSDHIEVSWQSVMNATSYRVYRRSGPGLNTEQIAEVTAAEYSDFAVDLSGVFHYFVIAANAAGPSGPSNEDSGWLAGLAPIITAVRPVAGLSSTEVTFRAELAGEPAHSWEWDLGGAGVPNFSSKEQPKATLLAPGVYHGKVTAHGVSGSTEFEFEFHVVEPAWAHTFGFYQQDAGRGIAIDGARDVFSNGFITPVDDTGKNVFCRFTHDGELIWMKAIEPLQQQTNSASTIGPDGNMYAVLTTRSWAGGEDGFTLVRIDPSGNLLSARKYLFNYPCDNPKMVFDAAGNLHIAVATSNHHNKTLLLKISPAGQLLWDKVASHSSESFHGVSNESLHVDGQGNLLMTADEGRIVKFSGAGNLLWSKEYGAQDHDHPYAAITDAAGYIYVGGGTGEVDIEENILRHSFILRLSPDGELLWQRSYEVLNYPSGFVDFDHLSFDSDNRLWGFIGGYGPLSATAHVMRFGPNGEVEGHWSLSDTLAYNEIEHVFLDAADYVYITGSAYKNDAIWSPQEAAQVPISLPLSDAPLDVVDATGEFTDIELELYDFSALMDSGFGASDLFAHKTHLLLLP